MRKLLFFVTAALFAASCTGDGKGKGDSGPDVQLYKNDLERLGIYGTVKEIYEYEKDGRRNSMAWYTIFNPAGNITEKGRVTRTGEKKYASDRKVAEIYEYGADGKLAMKTVFNVGGTSNIEKHYFDAEGRLMKTELYRVGYTGNTEPKLSEVTDYRYESNGKRKYDVYRNESLWKHVEYDRYGNVILETDYDRSGKEAGSTKAEYTYDDQNRLVKESIYKRRVADERKGEYYLSEDAVYEYGPEGFLAKKTHSIYNPDATEMQKYDPGAGINKVVNLYDERGSYISDGSRWSYDEEGNWVRRITPKRNSEPQREIFYYTLDEKGSVLQEIDLPWTELGMKSSAEFPHDKLDDAVRMTEAEKNGYGIEKIPTNFNNGGLTPEFVKGKDLYSGSKGTIRTFYVIYKDHMLREYMVSYTPGGDIIDHMLVGSMYNRPPGDRSEDDVDVVIEGNVITKRRMIPAYGGDEAEEMWNRYYITPGLEFKEETGY